MRSQLSPYALRSSFLMVLWKLGWGGGVLGGEGWRVEKVNGKSSIRFGNTGSFFKGNGKVASFRLVALKCGSGG